MGMTLSGIMNIGVSGAKAHQSAIAVASHNISNTNTLGYSRQRAELVTLPVLQTMNGQFGTGVQATTVTRSDSVFVDAALRAEAGAQARYDTSSSGLQDLDAVLTSSGGVPIGNALTDFFNSAQAMTTNPESLAVRQTFIDSGKKLANLFNTASQQLDLLHTGRDATISQDATTINSTLTQIADLNKQITTSEPNSGAANDLRDKRDALVLQLGSSMDLNVSEATNGSITITANGEALVSGFNVSPVQAASTGVPPQMEIQSGNGVSLTTMNGSLRGMKDTYDAEAALRSQLDTIAAGVISNVNAIHAAPGAAFDLNGNQGVAFFTGTDAASIAVNAVVAADPNKVAAASTAAPGSNGAILKLAQLQDQKVLPGGAGVSTLNDSLTNLASGVGSQAKNALDLKSVHDLALTTWQQRQQSINGVNMDEELSNMMTLQHAYQAAARVMSAVDMMMDTIINKMGA